MSFLPLCYHSQTTHLKIWIIDKVKKEGLANATFTVTINDTLQKTLTTNEDGAAPIIILGSSRRKNKVVFEMPHYQTRILKKVGIDEARGRSLSVYMKPLK